MNELSQFDEWLTGDPVAALVIREHLIPVDGPDGVFFPASFAAAEDKSVFPGGYNIDPPFGEKNVCLVDSVGSQANRIEPIFGKAPYAHLVPQVTVSAGDKSISLLEAGHRAGDAVVRCTALQPIVREAFRAVLGGDAVPLAKIAPTSLVFGVWDSRGTQAKLPRLISSTVRAFNVTRLRRSAQFIPATAYVEDHLLDVATDPGTRDAYAQRGFAHVPISGSPGGVIATGGIRRDAVLSLGALRLLAAGSDVERTLTLRRYVLGLCLVALTAPVATYLRQGCNLVRDTVKGYQFKRVRADGTQDAGDVPHAAALAFAHSAAAAFGVGESRDVVFDKALAKKEIAGAAEAKAKRRKSAKDVAESGPAAEA